MSLSISVQNINKLRTQTGAGLNDCKKALEESQGDFEKAIDYLRKKGRKIAAARGDRESKEGVVLAQVSKDGKVGYLLCLACETDFVAKNEQFIAFASAVLNIAIEKGSTSLEELGSQIFEEGITIQQKVDEMVGKIGEKIYFSKIERVEGERIVSYIHGANRIAVLIVINQHEEKAIEAGKNIAMQVAAMNPLSLDANSIDATVIKREEDILREQMESDPAMKSKPSEMLEKIAKGKLQSFFKENTLLSQNYVKDSSMTVEEYMKSVSTELKISSFKRVALG